MYKAFHETIIVLGLAAAPFSAAIPASAAEAVGVHVGPVGLGFTVGNGHYYDRYHHRHWYTYPSDYRSYHHSRSWYRDHRHWNDENHGDWYRR